MSFRIRPQTPADYHAIADLERAIPGLSTTPADVSEQASSPTFAAMVAERNGRIIGRACTGFWPQHTPAGDLRCVVVVDPAERRQGVGTALWEALQPIFQERRPKHLRANGKGNDPDSLAWAEQRGFLRAHHLLFQELELSTFDPTPWLEDLRKVESKGFCFIPFSKLHSPEAEIHLHTLYQSFRADTPDFNEGDHQPFESWRAWAFKSKGAWPSP